MANNHQLKPLFFTAPKDFTVPVLNFQKAALNFQKAAGDSVGFVPITELAKPPTNESMFEYDRTGAWVFCFDPNKSLHGIHVSRDYVARIHKFLSEIMPAEKPDVPNMTRSECLAEELNGWD